MRTLLNIATATTFVIAAAEPVRALPNHQAGVLLQADSQEFAAAEPSRLVQLAAALTEKRNVKQSSGQASGKRTHHPMSFIKEGGSPKKAAAPTHRRIPGISKVQTINPKRGY